MLGAVAGNCIFMAASTITVVVLSFFLKPAITNDGNGQKTEK